MIYYNKGGNMIGKLVKWIHDLEPTNLCVIMEEITEQSDEEERMFRLYDFITKEEFYALEDELSFL
jgi:hypothetical protein